MQVVPGRRRDLQVTRQSSLHEVTPPPRLRVKGHLLTELLAAGE